MSTCFGVVRVRRVTGNRHPWIVRKFAVGLTVLIVGYVTYVYAARFCRDMISKRSTALASQATGVVFLVVFGLFLFLMAWCYIMVIMTSPGDARLYTQRTTKPGYDHIDTSSSDVRGTLHEVPSPTPNPSHPTHGLAHNPGSSLGSGTVASVAASLVARPDQRSHSSHARATDDGAPESPPLPDAVPMHANSQHPLPPRPPPRFSRRPTSTPVLLPEHRYCSRCQIVKPSRAHHCRACGTCVLKYDHHCPWIGQCVGAFNQKFFVNFLQWATAFCFWTFSTLLGLNVKPRTVAAPALDPQQIVVIALAGLFGIFCSLILLTQLHLILLNQTTVESLHLRSMRDREQELLSHMHMWYQCCAKRRTRAEWDSEWGRIGIEGNLWWLGSRQANWEAVMGKSVWWWILPIGHHLGDGLDYPTNPRFDSAGRWKQRKEWPSDLR